LYGYNFLNSGGKIHEFHNILLSIFKAQNCALRINIPQSHITRNSFFVLVCGLVLAVAVPGNGG
jgi:hypothetical protein